MLTWNSPISFVAGTDALNVMALVASSSDLREEKGGEGMRKGEKASKCGGVGGCMGGWAGVFLLLTRHPDGEEQRAAMPIGKRHGDIPGSLQQGSLAFVVDSKSSQISVSTVLSQRPVFTGTPGCRSLVVVARMTLNPLETRHNHQ